MGRRWRPEDADRLGRMAAEAVPVRQIAAELHRTETAVKVYAKRHGIRLRSLDTIWTDEETRRFTSDWNDAEVSRRSLTRRYCRSWSALKQRACKLRLGPRPVSDLYVTRRELMEGVGVSWSRVSAWIRRGLPTHRSRTDRVHGALFDIDEVLSFLEAHQDEFDGGLVDPSFFYVLPDWFREKRRRDLSSTVRYRKRLWTPEEDSRLRDLFHLGRSDEELAGALGRTRKAVKARRWILGLARRAPCRA